MIIKALRLFVGLIAVWQILGLLPAFTWLSNLQAVTVGMWAMITIKFIVLAVCGGAYFLLGKVNKNPERSSH